ncbi:MAG: hypothetical protein QXQ68_07925 [Candidatus Nitrosocaldaceae archaeon]
MRGKENCSNKGNQVVKDIAISASTLKFRLPVREGKREVYAIKER